MLKRLIAALLIIALCIGIGASLYFMTPLGDMVDNLLREWITKNDDDGTETSYDKITASDYIHISNYNKKLDIHLEDFYDYRQAEFETRIANILNTFKPKEVYTNSDENYVPKITAGDTVMIYYRGYLLNEDGTKDYAADGMCNIENNATPKPHSLTIGNYKFIAGFETGMIGTSLSDYPKLEFITDGRATEDLIVFVSYSRRHLKEDGKYTNYSRSSQLVDFSLGKEQIDNKFGDGFYDFLLYGADDNGGQFLGENLVSYNKPVTFTIDGVDYEYTKLRVERAMEHYDYESYTPLEVRFPVDYLAGLSCKYSWFEIYVQDITEYYDDSKGEVVFNDDFLFANDKQALIGLTEDYTKNKPVNLEKRYPDITTDAERRVQYMLDDLASKYPHLETISDRYSQYLWDKITEEYEEKMEEKIENYIYNYYIENTEIKKYPEKIYEVTRAKILADLQESYEDYLALYAAYGLTAENYPIEEYAKHHICEENEDLEEALNRLAKEEVLRRLFARYIAKQENLDFSDAAIEKAFNDMVRENPSFTNEYFKNNPDEKPRDYDGREEELYIKVADYVKNKLYSGDISAVTEQYIVMNKLKEDRTEKITILD